MSNEAAQQQAPAQTQATETAHDTQQGQPGEQQQPKKMDSDSFFRHAYSIGEKAGIKQAEALLKEVFGTTDRAEIQKLAKKSVGQQEGTLPQTVLDQIAALQKENETLKSSIETQALTQNLHKEITGSGFSLHNPDLVRTMLNTEYDFRPINGELVAHRKGSDQPVVIENRFATVKTLLSSMSKDPATSFMFAHGQRVAAPQGVGTGTSKMDTLKDGELTNPAFVQALKTSGQYFDAVAGKPFDRDRVEKLIRK